MAETQVLLDTHKKLTQFWKDRWDVNQAICIYENEITEPPPNQPFIRFLLTFGRNRQITTGNNPLERSPNMVMVQICVPRQEGISRLLDLSDRAQAILRRKDILVNNVGGLIRFREAPYFRESGVQEENYYTGVVYAPYDRDAYT